MTTQATEEREIAELLVSSLGLDDVEAGEIDPNAPLFGTDAEGLGLDSIDALEIALAVHQRYGVELRADDDESTKIFATLRSLSNHVFKQSVEA